jgi:hypothetical protein
MQIWRVMRGFLGGREKKERKKKKRSPPHATNREKE